MSVEEPEPLAPGGPNPEGDQGLPPEEAWRVGAYGVLARLLAAPPDRAGLELTAGLASSPDDDEASQGPLAAAWRGLARAAQGADPEAVDDEYHDLFIGLGRGELVPYASWYLSGLLMEEPLVRLRQDLSALGFERRSGNRDPEDHIAALCEVMALLIRDGEPLERQRRFFNEHLAPWGGRFFRDLQEAEAARFYRSVGALGAPFVDLEEQHLAMSG